MHVILAVNVYISCRDEVRRNAFDRLSSLLRPELGKTRFTDIVLMGDWNARIIPDKPPYTCMEHHIARRVLQISLNDRVITAYNRVWTLYQLLHLVQLHVGRLTKSRLMHIPLRLSPCECFSDLLSSHSL